MLCYVFKKHMILFKENDKYYWVNSLYNKIRKFIKICMKLYENRNKSRILSIILNDRLNFLFQ